MQFFDLSNNINNEIKLFYFVFIFELKNLYFYFES